MKNIDFNNPIFQFISPFSNDQLLKMSKDEIDEFLGLLDNYYLELRDSLNLSKKITFGIEIEVDKTKSNMYKAIYDFNFKHNWNIENEDTLPVGDEVISPILVDKTKTWNDLRNICNIIKENGVISSDCGGHIHIGAQTLGKRERVGYIS